MSRNALTKGGALRDIPKNECEGDLGEEDHGAPSASYSSGFGESGRQERQAKKIAVTVYIRLKICSGKFRKVFCLYFYSFFF